MKRKNFPLNKLSSDKIFYIKRSGNYLRGEIVQLWFLEDGAEWQVLADKKIFKTAVLRNSAKRKLRELLKRNKIKKDISGLISFCNAEGLSRKFSAIESDYKKLIKKI